MSEKQDLLEKIANLEHEQWTDWSKNLYKDLIKICIITDDIQHRIKNNQEIYEVWEELLLHITQLQERLDRWEQLWIPYTELTEEWKGQVNQEGTDRYYAGLVLKTVLEDINDYLTNTKRNHL